MSTETQHGRQFDGDWKYHRSVPVLFGIFTLMTVIGWLVTVTLTAIHLFAIPTIPSDATVQGSIEVITSQWGYVAGIPLATLGGFYYLTTFGLALWWFDTRHPLIVKVLTPITATGVVFSAWFVYLQLGVIGEICPFCMVSAGVTVVLFGLELAILRRSSTPTVAALIPEFRQLVRRTNVALVVFPVLAGLLTLAGLYMVPLLPLPEYVPFA